MTRPRIGLLSSLDPRTPRDWSGTPYYMARALQRNVGPVEFLGPIHSWTHFQGRIRNRLARMRGGQFSFRHQLALARDYGRKWDRRLRGRTFDFLVAPAASTSIAFIETDIPIVYTSDATFDILINYHPEFTGLGTRLEREGHEIERRAIQRADLAIYPSVWAAESAVRTYGADPAKVHVLPYGANLETIPDRASLLNRKRSSPWTLLFVGSPWHRKGGPIACEVVTELRRTGVAAELVAVGARPTPGQRSTPGIRFVGRLDKSDPTQLRQLVDLLTEAHVLILPTLNDSYGIVFCEASACGTPSIAPRTGGVGGGGAIEEGTNGLLVPANAGSEAYATMVRELMTDWSRYERMVQSSRERFERRLNWDVWSRDVGCLATALISRGKTDPSL